MVYIADVNGFGLVMYDFKNNRSWRAETAPNQPNQPYYLRPNPQWSNFVIAGESFSLEDGVFGMALSPKTC